MYPLKNPILALCGVEVPSSEHVYMSGRFVDEELQQIVARVRASTAERERSLYADGLAVKQFAHKLILEGAEQLPDWNFAKLGLMHTAVSRKFIHNPDIAKRLLETGNQELVEGNDWEDRFWGVDPVGSRNGKNNLGIILMQVRQELTDIFK